MFRLISVLGLVLTVTSASAKEAFVCSEQQTAGFHSNKQGGYANTTFNNLGSTIVKENNIITVKRGNETTTYECRTPWKIKTNLLECTEQFYIFAFDTELLRYSRAEVFGYVANSTDSLSISYGDCQRL